MLEISPSRMSSGNLLFPCKLALYPDRVVIRKDRFFGSAERAIPITKIASVTANKAFWFSGIRIESSGGSEDIVADGFSAEDVRVFRDSLQSKLSSLAASSAPVAIQTGPLKLCRFCAESIQAAAIRCRFCGQML
jgi:hypothetical protein